jgi:hypothetical protein
MNYYRRVIIIFSVFCLWPLTAYAQLQDPTRPPGFDSGVVHTGAMDLSAIFISPGQRSAVIDNNIVHVGEQFDGMKVLSIEENTVMLYGPNGAVTVKLLETVRRVVNKKPQGNAAQSQ